VGPFPLAGGRGIFISKKGEGSEAFAETKSLPLEGRKEEESL